MKDLYKELFKEENYKLAYEEIKSKPGNMTPGVEKETMDGMSKEWIGKTIKSMKDCSFKFKPSKRIYITKANGKKRPLGIPSPKDKIVQRVMANVLEKGYEKIFLDSSHGFRPGKSCHTALKEARSWKRTTWVIEGDIKGYFDNIDHDKLYQLLSKRIKDKNFLDLIVKLMKAGYIETNTPKDELIVTPKGIPQGGLLSPLLSNIYLHELDVYIETLKKEYNEELESIYTPEYTKVCTEIRTAARRYGKERTKEKLKILRNLLKKRNKIEATKTKGVEINYVRYADDFVVGIIGTKKIAEEIRRKINEFLKKELLIELNMDKTKITNINRYFALFLGYNLGGTDRGFYQSLRVKGKSGRKARVGYGNLYLYIPVERVINKLREKGFLHATKDEGKYYGPWINLDIEEIIIRYKSVLMGICNYYVLARNVYKLSVVKYLLKYSAAHTIAAKGKMSLKEVFKKYGKNLSVKVGKNTVSMDYEPVIKKEYKAVDPFEVTNYQIRTKFIVDQPCKICGSTENVEAHHVRHLKDLNPKKSAIDAMMAKMKRKQIPLCRKCHEKVHSGKYSGPKL